MGKNSHFILQLVELHVIQTNEDYLVIVNYETMVHVLFEISLISDSNIINAL